jgi:hypothetical protein
VVAVDGFAEDARDDPEILFRAMPRRRSLDRKGTWLPPETLERRDRARADCSHATVFSSGPDVLEKDIRVEDAIVEGARQRSHDPNEIGGKPEKRHKTRRRWRISARFTKYFTMRERVPSARRRSELYERVQPYRRESV